MSTHLNTNNDQLLPLRQTNVSNPSIIHRAQSEQSITASEDYYSLSSASSNTLPVNDRSQHTIHRFQTPPSRYRTPLQSRDKLDTTAATNENQSPLRGPGQRRQSLENEVQAPAVSHFRDRTITGIRRKPVPSTVMEGSEPLMYPDNARSSVARAMARERNAQTPDVDDTPFIRFALEQLTRDEEVRGSRQYMGPRPNAEQNYRYTAITDEAVESEKESSAQPSLEMPDPTPAPLRYPPPRNPNRPMSSTQKSNEPKSLFQDADVFLPLAANDARPLNFKPAILRPASLAVFLLILLTYLVLLLLAAIWSVARTGLWNYRAFGDNRYFVFRYLPSFLGTILLLWLFQIQIAVTRIAPFLAMSSPKSKLRVAGPDLPIHAGDFLLPKFRYFRAGMPVVGFFMLVAWLQLFTIPLLAAAFNVYFVGSQPTGAWRWAAVQGVIWVIIALYILLFVATVTLLIHLARLEETGLRWDPRSLADLIAMLERSNALDEEAELRRDPARLGFWRTSGRPNEVFHAYGYANAQPRRYGVENGKIREKHHARASDDTDLEAGRWRHSKDAILGTERDEAVLGISYPWFLRLWATILWAVIALVLLLAFLIVSYLPSTKVLNGFLPRLPTIVDTLGFGADNFFFAFIPSILAMFCLLLWLNIDFAFRRFQPWASLVEREGDFAERNLLLSYPADLPIIVTGSAVANRHFRVAWLSFITLIAATLPTLAGGVFWAEFSIAQQRVRMSAHMPAYYALTVFLTLYALSYLITLPTTHTERELAAHAPRHGHSNASFADVLALVRNSRILDDFAFHGPASKTALVTRLLSIQPGVRFEAKPQRISAIPEASGVSLLSLADSLRGFGNARVKAIGGASASGVPKYGLARWAGRDGAEFWGIDRYR